MRVFPPTDLSKKNPEGFPYSPKVAQLPRVKACPGVARPTLCSSPYALLGPPSRHPSSFCLGSHSAHAQTRSGFTVRGCRRPGPALCVREWEKYAFPALCLGGFISGWRCSGSLGFFSACHVKAGHCLWPSRSPFML